MKSKFDFLIKLLFKKMYKFSANRHHFLHAVICSSNRSDQLADGETGSGKL